MAFEMFIIPCFSKKRCIKETKLYQGNKAVCLRYSIPGSQESTQNMVMSMVLQAQNIV